jgi:hypothetical protein
MMTTEKLGNSSYFHLKFEKYKKIINIVLINKHLNTQNIFYEKSKNYNCTYFYFPI